MPSQADDADCPSTLPPPELNPLLNPLLGQHMGRWAEVYFTSPPEKREQAVLGLLRELESGEAARQGNADSQSIPEQVSVSMTFPTSRIAKASPGSMICQSCGRENPAQKYCGMCGVRMEELNASARPIEGPRTESEAARPDENRVSHFFSLMPAVDEPQLIPRESGRLPYSEPASRPYRLYIGTALIILVLALCYIGWRGTQATSENLPAAQAPVTAQTKTPSPVRSTPTRNPPSAAPSSRVDHDRQIVPQATAIADSKPPTPTLSANGSEELAIAQNYLNGTGGKERNSEEAAIWLWKAVAKRNTDATLRLSDLFLNGDGVPKNCDQARVLLDAAANRGINAAGERLRHLQSFGCE